LPERDKKMEFTGWAALKQVPAPVFASAAVLFAALRQGDGQAEARCCWGNLGLLTSLENWATCHELRLARLGRAGSRSDLDAQSFRPARRSSQRANCRPAFPVDK